MRSVALDLGAKKIAYCEVLEGKVVARAMVGSLSSLEPVIGSRAPAARIAIEACREAWFVHEQLTAWGNEVLLVDTTRSRQLGIGQHGRKTDRVDAEVLARAVERGGIPLAHVLSPGRRELRRQVGVRRALIETRAQYITTIRGLIRERGAHVRSCDAEHFVVNVRKAGLSADVGAVIQPLIATVEVVQVQLAEVERRLSELSASEPIIEHLMTTPGVGPIVAASFVSVIDDAQRFRRAHQVESYIGLVPSENTSGGKRRLGAISKHGNSYLRALLVQSAWSILRQADRGNPLYPWAAAVAQRRGKKIAVVALARRLAGVLWAMWRDGTVYDPELAARSGARGLRSAAQSIDVRAAALERVAIKVRRRKAEAARTTEATNSQE